MKTQTFRTLRTGCLITIFLPLGGGGGGGGKNPVCHDSSKTTA